MSDIIVLCWVVLALLWLWRMECIQSKEKKKLSEIMTEDRDMWKDTAYKLLKLCKETDNEAQRRSFAYGNTALHNSDITPEIINEAAKNLRADEEATDAKMGE